MPLPPFLQRKLQNVLGPQAAEDLVNLLENLDANRGDVRELRHEMQLGFSRIEATVERTLREQTRFFFVAWAVVLAAIVGIYAR
ncbi:MAG TPA: hypothetical protein VEB21_01790 [Terriglobales bacterium]|nr:hypothetical protein [Terriglobales bacterium]